MLDRSLLLAAHVTNLIFKYDDTSNFNSHEI